MPPTTPRRRAEQPAAPDSVDEMVAEWRAELPDLPVDPTQVFVRLARIRARFDQELAELFARFDLSSADFALIAALRRAGEPYELPQSTLVQRLGLTSGTVSVRLTRLEARGVLARSVHPSDARGSLVRLTARGEELFAEVAPVHLANEELLLSALGNDERATLVDLLRRLLVSFEHPRSASSLGFSVAPAHEARRARQAVGLTDTAGLLVVDVEPGGPADAAGLRQGDLLTAVGDTGLTSCVTLAQHTTQARGDRAPLRLTLLRGTRRHTVSIPAA